MTEEDASSAGRKRRSKRFLTPSQKYEIWLQLVRQEVTIAEAAEQQRVDRSTVVRIRQVAKDGALAALAASKTRGGGQGPRRRAGGRSGGGRPTLGGDQTDGREVDVGRGKRRLGLSGRVPNRVDAATKSGLLVLLDEALAAGSTWRQACARLDLPERRANRWRRRREGGRLGDARPGGGPMHAILEQEADAILAVFQEWAEVDRSHRKLAHRGSYLGRFWCSPSTVRRTLLLGDKHFRPAPRPGKSSKSPFPEWAGLRPNSIWIYDSTHFTRCGMTVLIIEDLVSRKWLTHLVSVEETHTQVENAFTTALQSEGLLEAALERAGTRQLEVGSDDGLNPILLAVSDNGSQ